MEGKEDRGNGGEAEVEVERQQQGEGARGGAREGKNRGDEDAGRVIESVLERRSVSFESADADDDDDDDDDEVVVDARNSDSVFGARGYSDRTQRPRPQSPPEHLRVRMKRSNSTPGPRRPSRPLQRVRDTAQSPAVSPIFKRDHPDSSSSLQRAMQGGRAWHPEEASPSPDRGMAYRSALRFTGDNASPRPYHMQQYETYGDLRRLSSPRNSPLMRTFSRNLYKSLSISSLSLAPVSANRSPLDRVRGLEMHEPLSRSLHAGLRLSSTGQTREPPMSPRAMRSASLIVLRHPTSAGHTPSGSDVDEDEQEDGDGSGGGLSGDDDLNSVFSSVGGLDLQGLCTQQPPPFSLTAASSTESLDNGTSAPRSVRGGDLLRGESVDSFTLRSPYPDMGFKSGGRSGLMSPPRGSFSLASPPPLSHQDSVSSFDGDSPSTGRMASRNDATVVVTVDKDGHILTTDARIATLLSCQSSEVIGQNIGRFLSRPEKHPTPADAEFEPWTAEVLTTPTLGNVVQGRTVDGHSFVVAVWIKAVPAHPDIDRGPGTSPTATNTTTAAAATRMSPGQRLPAFGGVMSDPQSIGRGRGTGSSGSVSNAARLTSPSPPHARRSKPSWSSPLVRRRVGTVTRQGRVAGDAEFPLEEGSDEQPEQQQQQQQPVCGEGDKNHVSPLSRFLVVVEPAACFVTHCAFDAQTRSLVWGDSAFRALHNVPTSQFGGESGVALTRTVLPCLATEDVVAAAAEHSPLYAASTPIATSAFFPPPAVPSELFLRTPTQEQRQRIHEDVRNWTISNEQRNNGGCAASIIVVRQHVYPHISGVLTIDTQGNVVHANQNFVRLMFGRSKDAVVGRSIETLVPNMLFERRQLESSLSLSTPRDLLSTDMSLDGSHAVGRLPPLLENHGEAKALYADGAIMHISYQVKKVVQITGEPVFCVWMSCGAVADVVAAAQSTLGRQQAAGEHARTGLGEGQLYQDPALSRETTTAPVCEGGVGSDGHGVFDSNPLSTAPPQNQAGGLGRRDSGGSAHGSDSHGDSTERTAESVHDNDSDGDSGDARGGGNEGHGCSGEHGKRAARGPVRKDLPHPETTSGSQPNGAGDDDDDDDDDGGGGGGGGGDGSGMCSPVDQSTGHASMEPSPHESYAGDFAAHYRVLSMLGRGGFGVTYLAEERNTRAHASVKCIIKSRVLAENWEDCPDSIALPRLPDDTSQAGRIPREILLLYRLHHSNIPTITTLFHNPTHYQMVMPSHEPAFDLFRFIEENPAVEEPVASHVFRQAASAVAYLHACRVLHRDIKDENILLNFDLDVKLIDFGSACFMREEDEPLFDTFCGTTTYCAPEVLQGNRYRGPELDVYALGVTLYALLFGEFPFFTAEEAMEGRLYPPLFVSQPCMELLLGMLHVDAARRWTMERIAAHSWTTMDVQSTVDVLCADEAWQDLKQASMQQLGRTQAYADARMEKASE